MDLERINSSQAQVTKFLQSLMTYKDPKRASKAAGYSSLAACVASIAAHPGALAGIKEAQKTYIQLVLMPAGIKAMESILRSRKSTDQAKMQAVKHVSELADYLGAPTGSADKPMAEMSPAELQALVDKAAAAAEEKARRSKPVIDHNAQDSEQDTVQVSDIL